MHKTFSVKTNKSKSHLGNETHSINTVSTEFKQRVFVRRFLPFTLETDPGCNKTAITVPNSFIKSISTCSPECAERLALKSINWLDRRTPDFKAFDKHSLMIEGAESVQSKVGRPVKACIWRLAEGEKKKTGAR